MYLCVHKVDNRREREQTLAHGSLCTRVNEAGIIWTVYCFQDTMRGQPGYSQFPRGEVRVLDRFLVGTNIIHAVYHARTVGV